MRVQTNGLVERFNGRIEDALQSHRIRSSKISNRPRCATSAYNDQLLRSVLMGRTPINAHEGGQKQRPDPFGTRGHNQA